MALERCELLPRELVVTFTGELRLLGAIALLRFESVSEASGYRLIETHDLITRPNFIVMKAASEVKDKTTAPNQLWQTDFTYLKIIVWSRYYLSTIPDDYSRYIIA